MRTSNFSSTKTGGFKIDFLVSNTFILPQTELLCQHPWSLSANESLQVSLISLRFSVSIRFYYIQANELRRFRLLAGVSKLGKKLASLLPTGRFHLMQPPLCGISTIFG